MRLEHAGVVRDMGGADGARHGHVAVGIAAAPDTWFMGTDTPYGTGLRQFTIQVIFRRANGGVGGFCFDYRVVPLSWMLIVSG
jgi:hypothetical protein